MAAWEGETERRPGGDGGEEEMEVLSPSSERLLIFPGLAAGMWFGGPVGIQAGGLVRPKSGRTQPGGT